MDILNENKRQNGGWFLNSMDILNENKDIMEVGFSILSQHVDKLDF